MIPMTCVRSAVAVSRAGVALAHATRDPDLRASALTAADQAIGRAIDYITDGPGGNGRRTWLRWAHDLRREIIGAIGDESVDLSAILLRHERITNTLRHVRPA